MNNNPMAMRNLELSAEFSRYLFEHPEIEANLAPDAEIVLLPEFDTELRKYNEEIGRQMEANGERVVYVRVGHLRARSLSRLENVAMTS